MKKIIVLYGHHDCGKTHTINYLRELIRQNGGASLSSHPPYSGDKPETFRYNDETVCICPGGDSADIIKQNFEYAYSKDADILVTASRTRGNGPAYINKEATGLGIKIEWYQKSHEYHMCEATQELCNREFAEVLFKAL